MLSDERDYENFFAENKKYQENARITVLPANENELKNKPFSIRGLKRLNPFKFMINWCRKLKARVKKSIGLVFPEVESFWFRIALYCFYAKLSIFNLFIVAEHAQ